ncbi:Uncharacterized protein QJS10_CPA02g00987 [Acorus calamus]|uniref:Glutaredoxin domain-containing protein n=1 Tax=Acorus calamus TaxID=4465 RepID=A0AAV9FCR2_ACOCL|nr:Uncharacterized protein QJS10_CPA02g00987 [Acorus calamus]
MKRPLTPMGAKGGALERDFSPLFDPELIESFERELCKEQEQIKKMISSKPGKRKVFEGFEKRCPPGGEDAVVIYTTTLRGIRRTFEECNVVRSVIESHDVRTVERDVSMDSGFKEELRLLMGKNEVRVPMVFIKGWMIGGAEEMTKAEEAGRLEEMLEGIPRGPGWRCEGCGGMRFVMCFDCNGSCKVLDKEVKKMVKCAVCNKLTLSYTNNKSTAQFSQGSAPPA